MKCFHDQVFVEKRTLNFTNGKKEDLYQAECARCKEISMFCLSELQARKELQK